MNKYFHVFATMMIFTVLLGCKQNQINSEISNNPKCQTDNKICPDGSIVNRESPTCEFNCPPQKDDGFCDYGSPKRDYKGKDLSTCQRIKFACPENTEYFSDHCGCGCTVNYTPPDLSNSKVTNN